MVVLNITTSLSRCLFGTIRFQELVQGYFQPFVGFHHDFFSLGRCHVFFEETSWHQVRVIAQ